jgi:hypothetical protein
MKLTLFKNMKGLIHGNDPKRIRCDVRGVLADRYIPSRDFVYYILNERSI